jgi:hypothetical protein
MKDFFFVSIIFLIIPSFSSAKVIERVEAVVEGQMVLKSEVQEFKKNSDNQNLINQNLISLVGISEKPTNKEILDYLILKKMLVLQSKKEKGGVTLEELAENEINKLARQNNITADQLKREIISRGIDFEGYKRFIGESSLIRDTIERNVVSQVRPTEEDFVSYLKKNNINTISSSYTYDLDQIFISKGINDQTSLVSKINADNFREYFENAEKYGIDTLALGVLRFREISPKHKPFISAAKVNSITKPIQEENGFRIFYLNSKMTSFNIPNTKEIQALQRKFYDELIKDRFEVWSENIKQDFFVRINS